MTLERASVLLDLGRPSEALALLASLGDEATSSRAHNLRAVAHLRLKQPKEAAAAAKAGRIAAPSEEWGYRLGAIAALQSARIRDAVTLADEAVRLAPDDEFTHYVAALARVRASDLPIARLHSDEMLRIAPDSALAQQTAGRVLMGQGDLSGAEAALRQALALDPEDAESMSLLADVHAAQGRASAATELRLAAVRADPQNVQRQQSLLKRGVVAGTGAVLVVGKLGILKGLLLANGLRSFVAQGLGVGYLAVAVLIACGVAFAVSRVRRQRHGRELPPHVWQGLRSARRNSDLLWLAWPAGLVTLVAAVGAVVALLAGGSVVEPLGWVVGGVAVLSLCWAMRRGPARQQTLVDELKQIGQIARVLLDWVRGLRRDPGPAGTTWVRTESPIGDDRYPLALIYVFLALTAGTSAGLAWGAAAFFVVSIGTAMALGAVFDGWQRTNAVARLRVVQVGTLEPAGRLRLAVRAGLRLALLPMILVEVVLAGRKPRRFLHDRLTGTEHIGLRPA